MIAQAVHTRLMLEPYPVFARELTDWLNITREQTYAALVHLEGRGLARVVVEHRDDAMPIRRWEAWPDVAMMERT